MPGVKIKQNESLENALRRFKKQCEKASILSEIKKREYYERPSVRRKKNDGSEEKAWTFWHQILLR